ncbi:MAG: branched-chain amino acid ABC transporter permease [Candidatus Abyssobacteria bacterium SURF_17]|uniref:Branched-chain amino acid ABC transporter permease n=1 Tax=Candidatus Abyssobacteria bacterium SURF_17 TaxID=2093361 RepID=A0A419F6P5_9BACT|nr:MAG: branched-chain amino acid ABC transporter permease [Candidatus Abyssubacteria bacterium SURF_17]
MKHYISLAFFIVVVMGLPMIVRNPYYVGTLVFVGIYSLITISLSLLLGYAGQISLGHAAFYGIGAYTSGLLATRCHLSPWIGLVCAAVVAGVLAYSIGRPVLKLRGHYLAMATLGFGEIVYIFLNSTVELTGGPSGFGQIPRFAVGAFSFKNDTRFYYLVWVTVIILLVLVLNVINSRIGRALRSIHGSETAANTMGVNTASYKMQVFVFSAAVSSIAGAYYAHYVTFVSPATFDANTSILLVTMVIIGGMSNVWGAILGALLLGTLPEYLRTFGDYDILIYGAIMLIIMMFAPEGLAGIAAAVKRKFEGTLVPRAAA